MAWTGQLSEACLCPPYSYPQGERVLGGCEAAEQLGGRGLLTEGVQRFGPQDDDTAWCACRRGVRPHMNPSEECYSLLLSVQVVGTV